MNIKSPITQSLNTVVIENIPTSLIVTSYKETLDIDVSRFFSGLDIIQICKCIDTNYLFYSPFGIDGDELFYDELKIQLPIKFNAPYYSKWKWEYEYCLQFFKSTDKVYEIGCGYGDFLRNLKKIGVFDVHGSELNDESVRVAKSDGLDVEFITIQNKAKNCRNEYDVVCSFQVLEHISDIKSFLESVISLLKPGGRLIIGVPFNDPYLFSHDIYNTLNMPPHHMGLWNHISLVNLTKFFPIKNERIIVEKLPNSGYDFEQYYRINKDINYAPNLPFKKLYDKLYLLWLKRNHFKKNGKNIIAVFNKN